MVCVAADLKSSLPEDTVAELLYCEEDARSYPRCSSFYEVFSIAQSPPETPEQSQEQSRNYLLCLIDI